MIHISSLVHTSAASLIPGIRGLCVSASLAAFARILDLVSALSFVSGSLRNRYKGCLCTSQLCRRT